MDNIHPYMTSRGHPCNTTFSPTVCLQIHTNTELITLLTIRGNSSSWSWKITQNNHFWLSADYAKHHGRCSTSVPPAQEFTCRVTPWDIWEKPQKVRVTCPGYEKHTRTRFSSSQLLFKHTVVSDSQPHGLQQARASLSFTPSRVCSNSCPLMPCPPQLHSSLNFALSTSHKAISRGAQKYLIQTGPVGGLSGAYFVPWFL